MAKTKYGDLVKNLSFTKSIMGGANARDLVFVSGKDLGGFDFNFIIGIYDQVGDWAPGRGAHAHPFDECLIFFGHDINNLGYLGSEMEICLGQEQESHIFNTPTVVVAPRDVGHCPLITKKVYQPFGHFHLALNAKYSAKQVQKEGETDGTKYNYLVKEFKIKPGNGRSSAAQVFEMSAAELEGLPLNFTMGLFNKAGNLYPGEGPHVHPYDECLVFFGHDTQDIRYLGAEISVEIGKEHEKYTFDVPTVISFPKGLPHLPIICNKLDKPFGVMQVGIGARYTASAVA